MSFQLVVDICCQLLCAADICGMNYVSYDVSVVKYCHFDVCMYYLYFNIVK